MAKLSVVVPFFNVEAFIAEALESIAKQTLRDIEVIMVDDGSADGSSVIAKSFAARDPRFKLVQQQNQGLGPARNAGIRHATGRYLAFADSDDLLDLHAYGLLVGSLDQTGSDIACGGVRRFRSTGLEPSWLHDEPFRETVLRTHVTRRPVLLRDRTAWNKVFRRSFWDEHSLEFPGILYEDGPVVLRAHVLASSVDIFRNIVYYWRVRDSGELSITQRARDVSNLEHRMASVGSVATFLAEAAPALKPVYDQSVLNVDLGLLVRAYEIASPSGRRRLAELASDYLSTVDESVYRGVTAAKRLQYYLLRKEMYPELLQALRYWRRGDGSGTPVVRSDTRPLRWYANYPYFREPASGIPDEVYDVTDEMTLNARLDVVTWRAGKLRIEGHAYIRRINSATPADCKIDVVLRNNKARRTIRLRAERIFRPDVTARSAQAAACYDWSGFVVEVNPRRLAIAPGVWRGANWELRVEVCGDGLRREGPIDSVAPGSAQWPEGRWLTGRVWVQPAAEYDGRFFIRCRRVRAFVTGCRSTGDALEIEGWTKSKLASGATLVLAPRVGGAASTRVPAEATQDGGPHGRSYVSGRTGFRARVPVTLLEGSAANASAIDQAIHVHDELTRDLSIAPGGGKAAVRLTIAPGTAGARARGGRREVTAFVTHFGYLSMLERTVRPVVTHLEWTDDQRLLLRGDHTDPNSQPAELLLRYRESTEAHVVPLTWEQHAFVAEFAPGRMPSLAGELPLAAGNWNMLARTGDGKEVTVAASRGLLASLPGYHSVGTHEIEAQPYRTDALRLKVRTAIGDDERGRYAQRQLQQHDYPLARARLLRDLAVFDSFGGRLYACNPRAIYERLRQVRPGLECAWVSRDGQFNVPDGGRVVLADSRDHFEMLAQARYVILNDTLPAWFSKRDGQFCLQTWHGTPLKRIGLDIEAPQFATGLIYPDVLRKDVADWDVLLSPNGFSTPIFRRAFGYSGEIMESGYPRNDLLHCSGREKRGAAIREQLGLPQGKRVVLYAPTWRDDALLLYGRYRFELQLDLDAAARALGHDYVLLLHLHTNVRRVGQPSPVGGFVFDVTQYPDITDLYLISDVLITDYSSVMFDFAGTRRPMLFFTYDLERYRDQLRGFYFDFEADAPGPLLRTSDEVIGALRDLTNVERLYKQKYDAFVSRFCALDDGRAASRVVDRLLDGV